MNRMNDTDRDELARILEQIVAEATEDGETTFSLDVALDAIAETVLPDTISRYFEAHITVEPHPEHTFEEFTEAMIIGGSKWRTSRFEEDHVDEIAGKWFASFRSPSYTEILNEVRGTVHSLLAADTTVLRYKIEETLLDSKLGDTL